MKDSGGDPYRETHSECVMCGKDGCKEPHCTDGEHTCMHVNTGRPLVDVGGALCHVGACADEYKRETMRLDLVGLALQLQERQ